MRVALKAVRDFLRKADLLLLFLCICAAAYGCLLISSAAQPLPGGSRGFVIRQAAAAGLGVGLYLLFTLIDVNIYRRFRYVLAAFNVLFLLLLIPFGKEVGGNRSWLSFDWLPFDIQPAEIVKITFVVLLAGHMYALKDVINKPLPMLSVLAHVGAQVGLVILVSEDVGVSLIYVFAFIAMAICGGVKPRWFVAAGVSLAAAAPVVWTFLSETRRKRIVYFFSPESDPLDMGYQIIQSKRAFAGGGLLGEGLYRGTQIQARKIPFQWSDFVFASAGEELGFFLAALIPALLTAIILRVLYNAYRAYDGYGSLICAGIAGTVMFQMFENIGMCIGVMPIIGITLPFFSYGGSSLLSMFAAVGLVSSVKYRGRPPRWLSR